MGCSYRLDRDETGLFSRTRLSAGRPGWPRPFGRVKPSAPSAFGGRDNALSPNKLDQRLHVRQNKIWARNGIVERDSAAVDPGDGQSERLAADQIGKLGLPGVKDLVPGAARIFNQITKQRAIRLVPFRPLCRAHQIEISR